MFVVGTKRNKNIISKFKSRFGDYETIPKSRKMFSRKTLPEVFTLNDSLYSFIFDGFIHAFKNINNEKS